MTDVGARALSAAICLSVVKDYFRFRKAGGDKPFTKCPEKPCERACKKSPRDCRSECELYQQWKEDVHKWRKLNKHRIDYRRLVDFVEGDSGLAYFGAFGMRPDFVLRILDEKYNNGGYDSLAESMLQL